MYFFLFEIFLRTACSLLWRFFSFFFSFHFYFFKLSFWFDYFSFGIVFSNSIFLCQWRFFQWNFIKNSYWIYPLFLILLSFPSYLLYNIIFIFLPESLYWWVFNGFFFMIMFFLFTIFTSRQKLLYFWYCNFIFNEIYLQKLLD